MRVYDPFNPYSISRCVSVSVCDVSVTEWKYPLKIKVYTNPTYLTDVFDVTPTCSYNKWVSAICPALSFSAAMSLCDHSLEWEASLPNDLALDIIFYEMYRTWTIIFNGTHYRFNAI